MLTEHGPVVAALAFFVLGLVASLTPGFYPGIPRTVSFLGADAEPSLSRRTALSATFVLGIAALLTPLGLVSALCGSLSRWIFWTSVGGGGLVLFVIALAASTFGFFELALPASLRTKLSAVGGGGSLRGAFAMGLVIALIDAPATLPLVIGSSIVVALTANVWIGALALFSFSLGLGALSFVAGTRAVSLPRPGAWTIGMQWASGVGLGYLAFALVHERSNAVHEFVRDPSYTLGIVSGIVFVVGLVLGGIHVLAERRASTIARLSKPMRLASIVPAVVGCALFVSWAPYPHGNAPPITWHADEVVARLTAADENKPMVVVFNATWCCKEVEHDMFFDPRVREEAKRFVAIAVDASDDENAYVQQLQEKYKVVGLPTIIILDSAGNEVSRIQSIVDPVSLVAEMKKAPATPALLPR